MQLTTDTVFNTLSRAEKEQILSIPLDRKKTLMNIPEKQVLIDRLKAHAGVKEALVIHDILYNRSSALFTES